MKKLVNFLKKKKVICTLIFIIVICLLFFSCHHSNAKNTEDTVVVSRGSIMQQALAVGSIRPEHSISVTSTIPGTVKQLFHHEGEFVKAGEPLLEVRPNPTPQELNAAKRDLDQKKIIEQTTKAHLARLQHLLKQHYITLDDYDKASQDFKNAELDRKLAEEKLALLAEGKATISGQLVQNIVNSPIDGYIFSRKVDVGDPVVPQTDSQSGNTLFTIANIDDLIFKGQVNEIDVSKIHEGMPASIALGALTDKTITGILTEIALQSTQNGDQDAATGQANSANSSSSSPFNVSFEVTIAHLQMPTDVKLRAGYSANAEIMIKQVKQALVIPERVLVFENDKTYVWVSGHKTKKPEKRAIQLGISDEINAEVINGLQEGEKVLDMALTAENHTSLSVS